MNHPNPTAGITPLTSPRSQPQDPRKPYREAISALGDRGGFAQTLGDLATNTIDREGHFLEVLGSTLSAADSTNSAKLIEAFGLQSLCNLTPQDRMTLLAETFPDLLTKEAA